MGKKLETEVQVLAPPFEQKQTVKDKFWIVPEMLWVTILIIPYILFEIFKKIFKSKGKCLKDQVVVVTGAGRGLGRGLAQAFAREGCQVAVVDINRDSADNTAAEIVNSGGVAKAYVTNVANVGEVSALRDAVARDLGPTDILVHNAGLIYEQPLTDSQVDDVKAVVAVNLTSYFWMVQEFLPAMQRRNSGHIVAISSVAGLLGVANLGVYSATKYGVIGLMEALREELKTRKENKVYTTTVCPYFINTSAQYVENWHCRFPPMSIEYAVRQTISAVKGNKEIVTIPGCFYEAIQLMRLFPQGIIDRYREVLRVRIVPTSKTDTANRPATAIIKEVVKQNS